MAHAVLAERHRRADAEASAVADGTADDAPALHSRAYDEAFGLADDRTNKAADRDAYSATQRVALHRANTRALSCSFGGPDSSPLVVTITHSDAPSIGTAIGDSVGAAICGPVGSPDADNTPDADSAADTANAEANGIANIARANESANDIGAILGAVANTVATSKLPTLNHADPESHIASADAHSTRCRGSGGEDSSEHTWSLAGAPCFHSRAFAGPSDACALILTVILTIRQPDTGASSFAARTHPHACCRATRIAWRSRCRSSDGPCCGVVCRARTRCGAHATAAPQCALRSQSGCVPGGELATLRCRLSSRHLRRESCACDAGSTRAQVCQQQ